MTQNLINTGILAAAFLALFATAELLYHRFKFRAEITRKIVHVFTGILTLLFPPMVENHWLVLALCASFLLILLASFPLKMLPSINAVNRKTNGSILYPIIVYSCYLIYQSYDNLAFYYIPILILALCDPTAALVGKNFPKGKYTTFGHSKTLSGSFGFLLAALILSVLLLVFMEQVPFSTALIIGGCIACTTAFAEAISHRGYDNLTIPATAVGVLLFFEHYTLFNV
jgi:dolichol kinase